MEGTSVSVSAASEITMEKVGATTTTTDERDEMTNLSDHVQTNLNINSSNIVGGGGGGGGINIVTSSGEDEGASGNDGFNCRRIQVSREKRPLSFFVTLSKKFLLTDDMIELSGLGLAVTTVVTIAEILKKSNLISIKRTSSHLFFCFFAKKELIHSFLTPFYKSNQTSLQLYMCTCLLNYVIRNLTRSFFIFIM